MSHATTTTITEVESTVHSRCYDLGTRCFHRCHLLRIKAADVHKHYLLILLLLQPLLCPLLDLQPFLLDGNLALLSGLELQPLILLVPFLLSLQLLFVVHHLL